MKISAVELEDILHFCRIDEEDIQEQEQREIMQIIAPAAKSYILHETGMKEEELDKFEDLTIAYLVLIDEMYDNRVFTVSKDTVNKIVSNILSMHPRNLL